MPTNDNHPAMPGITPPMPDAHGQAALLLVESLIHGLMERSVLSVGEAIDIVETADSVQVDAAIEADGHGEPLWRGHALLSAIAASLKQIGDGDRQTFARHDSETATKRTNGS